MQVQYRVKLVPDKPAPEKCIMCKTVLSEYQRESGPYCADCAEKISEQELGHAIYSSCHLHHQYLVDGNGMIWEGLPDNPDMWSKFDELPIVHYHPEPAHYKELKISHLLGQIRVMSDRKPTFDCFICNQVHDNPRLH